MFIDPTKASFTVDIWSLAASLYHLVAKELPFECSTPIIASVNITDMTNAAPDVREKAPANYRERISPMFAGAISKGLQKDLGKRFHSTDEMCMAFHRCLVQQKLGAYSVYISYDHSPSDTLSSDRICAALLYNALNNTETRGRNRVFACMRPLELKSGDAWEGFSEGFQNSLLLIPVISGATIKQLESLKGSKEDPVSDFLTELTLMQSFGRNPSQQVKFQKLMPFLLQTGNGGRAEGLSAQNLVPRASAPSKRAADAFLKSSSLPNDLDNDAVNCSVHSTVEAFLQAQDALHFRPSSEEAWSRSFAEGSAADSNPSLGASDSGLGSKAPPVSGEDSEIVERLCKLHIVREESVAAVLAWRDEIKHVVLQIYDEIDKASVGDWCGLGP
jgi:serine/threonine protein kinase